MYSNITGIILAGGKSTRMGKNKSLLFLNGKTVIERVVNLMKSVFTQVIIISNTPKDYSFINIPIFKDIYEYKGPLAGIHSGLYNSKTEANFIISCDIPLMNEKMIKYIVDYKTNEPITVCKADGFTQQLVGKYSRAILPVAEELLRVNTTEICYQTQTKRKCAVLSLLDKVGVKIIEAEQLVIYHEHLYYNMNKTEDYQFIQEIILNNELLRGQD
jgi:molybdenum cofactor guanylyltransferase